MLMVNKNILIYILLVNTCFSQISEEFPTIESFGSKFFFENTGEQFFMKGIAYQPSPQELKTQKSSNDVKDNMEEENNFEENVRYIDPLGNPNICLRDIPYFKRLGINTIEYMLLIHNRIMIYA